MQPFVLDHVRASDIGSRKIIDTAIGVLVGARRRAPAEAFEDLATAGHDTGIGLGTLASALVTLASRTAEPFPHRDVVTARWSTLLATGVMKPKAAEQVHAAPVIRERRQVPQARTSRPKGILTAGEDRP